MKELSIEQKAKAHDEAIKVIKDNLDALNEITETGAEVVNIQSIKNCFYRAFPELKESKDERIRKCIGDVVREHDWSHIFGVTKDDCLAWLEKQGSQILANSAKICKDEQKLTDNDIKEALRTEYEKGRADAIAEMQVAWSEEEEMMFEKILQQFTTANNNCKLNNASFTYDKEISFLKSLKDRVQSKPILRRTHTIFDQII